MDTIETALQRPGPLQLTCMNENASSIVDRATGSCLYKLIRPDKFARRWVFELHVGEAMFNTASPSEVVHILREGFKDEGGLATASRRFLFTFKGEEFIWQKHRRFSGDNLSCIRAASKKEVAYYKSASILKRKEDGKLTIAEEVHDIELLHILVAGCLSYREWLERRDMLVWGDVWFSQNVSC
eukprot:jgi/Astpho2/2049/fgenesh1_pg.00038_%23_138_t